MSTISTPRNVCQSFNNVPYFPTWTNETGVEISWMEPWDDSGIHGVFYKIGEPPTADDDGEFTTLRTFSITVPSIEGEQEIYLWAKDNAANANYLNHSTVTVRIDLTAPEISSLAAPGFSPNANGFNDTTDLNFHKGDT